MKNRIRLTESQLHRVIKESVKKVIKEDIFDPVPLEKCSPHTQKMAQMFSTLNDVIEQISQYARKQGIYTYSKPQRGHVKASFNDEIRTILNNMREESAELLRIWGKHLYYSDENYRDREDFQLP